MDQLRALMGLRWQMVRSRRVRLGLLALAGSLPLAALGAGLAGQLVRDGDLSFNILLLTPSLFLGFAILALAAPLSAGGGAELFPSEQLVAFPVRPQTVYLASLVSAPLNLAWATQVVTLVAAVSFVADQGPLVVLSMVTALAYVFLVTAAGQSLAWLVVGIRQSGPGRLLVWAVAAGLGVALGLVLLLGQGVALLDRSPTTGVVIAAIQGSQRAFLSWALTTAVLVALGLAAMVAGARACDWALRRPNDDLRLAELQQQARRSPASGHFQALLQTDRASVWRSASLRRGLLVLALLPGLVAAVARVEWGTLALLPGLVAAGAGMLFGVNAFCLDGSGGIWLASLPHSGRTSAWAKAVVTTEACLVAVVLAVGTAALRARGAPTPADLTAVLGSVVGCTALVVSTCLRLSVERPHRADLRGPRDAPAPPATMAVYSLRLAVSTTLLGMLFTGAAASGSWPVGLLLGLAVLLWSARSTLRTLAIWVIPAERARVVLTVATG